MTSDMGGDFDNEVVAQAVAATIDNGDPAIQATGMWQMMRGACYAFEEAYNAAGGNCTVVDLPEEGITGNDHFLFQDLNNDVIAAHVQAWIEENIT